MGNKPLYTLLNLQITLWAKYHDHLQGKETNTQVKHSSKVTQLA